MVNITKSVPNGVGTTYTIKKGTGYTHNVYLSTDITNCKLSYIHGAGNLGSYGYTPEEMKQIFDEILRGAKGCIILNTINLEVFNFIKETYPVYYAQKVPIGYNHGFQYHVCFKNVITVNGNCREPEPLKVEKATPVKTTIKQKLEAILKIKRRKADYVDEFINSL